jgi:hypothetical protein
VCFFLALAGLHLSIAIPAFYHHRWTGSSAWRSGDLRARRAAMCWMINSELTIQRPRRRSDSARASAVDTIQRYIPFENVHGVRLMM